MAKKTKRTSSKAKAKPRAKRSKAKALKPWWKHLIKLGFIAGLRAGIVLSLLLAWYAQELPDITKSASFERQTSIIVKAANGEIIARYGESMGNSVTIDELPPHLINAVLATEDRRFYKHFGLDLKGFTRAMVVNVRRGGFVQGGSTITQQLAKNLFLTRERKIKRKIQEAMLAFWLEYELSKDEILSAYLNRVYMGAGTYGVDAAAQRYFNKEATDLSLRESAVLAGLLKAPSRYSPTNNPLLAKQRSDVVISSMVAAGFLTQDEATLEKNHPPRPRSKPKNADSVRYYTDWVVDSLGELIGTPTEDIIITTNFNAKAQNAAQSALMKSMMRDGDTKNMEQGAVVVMTLKGAVVAMVGGRDYKLSEFNRATQSLRPPGSLFKPFVYLAALERGWTPNSLILDAKFTSGSYKPKNIGHKYHGEVDLYSALTFSLNTPAVRLAKSIGIGQVIDTAKKLGITAPLEPDLSLSLGSSGVSLLELTSAYAIIGNGGHAIKPYGITKIEGAGGTLYYQHTSPKTYKKYFSSYAIESLKLMMASVVQNGTGKGAATGFPVAGKTGTSQESRDALFAGFSDELAAIVWVGNDDNSPMKGVTGGSNPARIWRETMQKTRHMYPRSLQGGFSSDEFLALLEHITWNDETPDGIPEEIPKESLTRSKKEPETEVTQRKRIPHRSNARYND